MPSIGAVKPVTMPISKRVPSELTWNSSTVPAPPFSTYRKWSLGVTAASVVPSSVEAAIPHQSGHPTAADLE